MIFVYCPQEEQATVSKILRKLNVSHTINLYCHDEIQGEIVCHYNPSNLKKEHQDFLIKAMKYSVKVFPLTDFIERKFGYVEPDLLDGEFFFRNKTFPILCRKHHSVTKRLLDLFMVGLLAPIALPIGIITAIAIKLESKGDVFFKQERVGKHNKLFKVIKFRSMTMDAEKNGAQWASKNDARVTKVGNFIRKTRIDELPQLLNVLKGDMSMVGARPEREVFISELEKHIPYYRFRHAADVGITGLAQVKYAYGASVEDAIWKHKYDMYYIKNQCLLLDLKILALTVKTVLFGMGR